MKGERKMNQPRTSRIKAELRSRRANPKLRDYMVRLVTDSREFEAYRQNPEVRLAQATVDAVGIDLSLLTALVELLRERHARGDYATEATVTTKKQEAERVYNFDNSGSWVINKESSIFRTRGMFRETTVSEEMMIRESFHREGVFQEARLQEDIDLAFFPSQPLISQPLLERLMQIAHEEDAE
jgi:hypothetical protein